VLVRGDLVFFASVAGIDLRLLCSDLLDVFLGFHLIRCEHKPSLLLTSAFS
jgi:hypothetical protein